MNAGGSVSLLARPSGESRQAQVGIATADSTCDGPGGEGGRREACTVT